MCSDLQLVRMPLDEAGPDIKLVESLQPMWDEEKQRLGASPPAPPAGPERVPQVLCQHVETVRAQFQVCRWPAGGNVSCIDRQGPTESVRRYISKRDSEGKIPCVWSIC